jgi:hypothetical protein
VVGARHGDDNGAIAAHGATFDGPRSSFAPSRPFSPSIDSAAAVCAPALVEDPNIRALVVVPPPPSTFAATSLVFAETRKVISAAVHYSRSPSLPQLPQPL